MSKFLPLLAERVLNRPLLLDPAKAEIILAVLEGRILPSFGDSEGAAGAELETAPPQPGASRFVGSGARQTRHGSFVRASGNTAIVTIDGSLVNRGAWIGASSGMTSYEGIGAQLDDIANDQEIKNVLIDMNSPGGEATGMFMVASKVRQLSKKKRVVAVVNDMAASAGFGIVSGADEIVVSPTSVVGSIGVVMMHLDRSGEMQMKGIRPTFIHAGAHKVDGNSFGPLSDEVRAALQRDVNTFYDRFLETVEAGRGKSRLSANKARATEARTFIGQQAIDAGLADRIGSFEQVLAELQRPAASSGGTSKKGTSRMEEETNINAGGISQEKHTAAVNAARSEGEAAGRKAGAADEKARVKSILTSEHAGGREATAQHLALETDMSAEDAGKLLATLPKGQAAPEAKQPIPTIEQRSQNAPEMGGSDVPQATAQIAKAGWGKAFARFS